jgi:hypothetical protein
VFADAPGVLRTQQDNAPTANQGLGSSTRVLIISSVLFTFIGAWRTAAVVLCDLASTAYYIGGANSTGSSRFGMNKPTTNRLALPSA